MSTTLSVAEAQGKLSQLLELAQAGHEVIIQDPQKGKARLVPLAPPAMPGPRRFGLHPGEVWMSDDFNAPLSDSFWLNDKAE
jgi:antitoxin (DNA-binding transcriptional repressor) of toxin-antitoxin stability system